MEDSRNYSNHQGRQQLPPNANGRAQQPGYNQQGYTPQQQGYSQQGYSQSDYNMQNRQAQASSRNGQQPHNGNGGYSGNNSRQNPQQNRGNRQNGGNNGSNQPMIKPVTHNDVRRSVFAGSIITIIVVLVIVLGITALATNARMNQLQSTIDQANAIVEQAKSEVSLSPAKDTVSKVVSTNVNITVIKGASTTTVNKPAENNTSIGNSNNANNGNTSSNSNNANNGNTSSNSSNGNAENSNTNNASNANGTASNNNTNGSEINNENTTVSGSDTMDQNATRNIDGNANQTDDNKNTSADEEVHGSGIVVTSDGNIVTCLHVVENAKSITVEINGTSYQATVTGTDPTSDIATIKIDAKDLPVAQFGDSSQLYQGDWVMAVGNPYGLTDTITTGSVSALDRDIAYNGNNSTILYADMIQTDATVNPGNSGGGLYNANGELVGMVAVITADNDASVGIAYAIPSNLLAPIARNLVQGKNAQHAVIGASLSDVTQDMVTQYGLQNSNGAVITSVTPSGPADNVKLTTNDIIIEYDGKAVKNAQDLLFKIRASEINQTVTLKVLRNGKEMSFNIKLGSDV